MGNSINNIMIQYGEKNDNKNEEDLNLPSFIEFGDVIYSLDTIRRESSMTEKQKKERGEEMLLKKKNKMENLKKKKEGKH